MSTVLQTSFTEIGPDRSAAQSFRSHLGHISRQSLVFFLGTTFTAASGYLFKIYLARVLGADALGIYVLGMTIVGFVGIFNGLGLPHTAVRFVSAHSGTARLDRLRMLLGRGTGLLLLANGLFAGILLVLGPAIARRAYHAPALVPYLHFFIWIMFFGALTTFFGQVLAGYKDVTRRTLITNFVGVPCTVVLTASLVFKGWGLSGYLMAQVASSFLVLVLLLAAIFKLTPPEARPWAASIPELDSEILSFSSAVFGMGLLEFVLAQADKILIGIYLNVRQVGIYAVAATIVSFIPIVLQSVNQIFSPTIADLHARSEHDLLQRLFQILTKWVLGLTLPLAVAVIIFAAPLMRIFGADFESGWPILVIGTVGQLVNCGVGSVGYLLLMSGRQSRLLKVQSIMAILMLLLSLALIPVYGIYGAALAAAFVNVGTNLWNLREVRASLGFSPYNIGYFRLLPPLLASTLAMWALKVVASALRPQWVLILVALLLGYTVFFGIFFLLGSSGDDRLLAAAAWNRARVTLQRLAVVKP